MTPLGRFLREGRSPIIATMLLRAGAMLDFTGRSAEEVMRKREEDMVPESYYNYDPSYPYTPRLLILVLTRTGRLSNPSSAESEGPAAGSVYAVRLTRKFPASLPWSRGATPSRRRRRRLYTSGFSVFLQAHFSRSFPSGGIPMTYLVGSRDGGNLHGAGAAGTPTQIPNLTREILNV